MGVFFCRSLIGFWLLCNVSDTSSPVLVSTKPRGACFLIASRAPPTSQFSRGWFSPAPPLRAGVSPVGVAYPYLKITMTETEYFTIGEINETYERYQFNDRNQGTEESIDSYVSALRNLAKTCNFCECLHDSLIRDRVVFGIRSLQTRQRLLQERTLDLKKCIDICRSAEAAAAQMNALSGDFQKTKSKQKNDLNVPARKPII